MTVLSKELQINKNIPYSGAMIYWWICKLQRNEQSVLFILLERKRINKEPEKNIIHKYDLVNLFCFSVHPNMAG